MENKSFFIIGTDTDIGKTYVSTLLFSVLKKYRGYYYKPIQSGCKKIGEQLIAPDVEFLCNFNNLEYAENMCSYKLIPEMSPHIAAEIDNVKIEEKKILEDFEKLKSEYEYLIVEGAGGLIVPLIRDKFYVADLIKRMNIPVVIVCSPKIGSINHTILTVNNLKQLNIDIKGIVFNNYSEDKEKEIYQKDNIKEILKLSGVDNYLIIKNGQNSLNDSEILEFINR